MVYGSLVQWTHCRFSFGIFGPLGDFDNLGSYKKKLAILPCKQKGQVYTLDRIKKSVKSVDLTLILCSNKKKGDSKESPQRCKISDQIFQLNSAAPIIYSKKLKLIVNPFYINAQKSMNCTDAEK